MATEVCQARSRQANVPFPPELHSLTLSSLLPAYEGKRFNPEYCNGPSVSRILRSAVSDPLHSYIRTWSLVRSTTPGPPQRSSSAWTVSLLSLRSHSIPLAQRASDLSGSLVRCAALEDHRVRFTSHVSLASLRVPARRPLQLA